MIPTLHAVGMVQLVGSMATTRGAKGAAVRVLLLMVQKSGDHHLGCKQTL